jgi:DNA-binding GntR family transcriptional regulator
MRFQYQIIHQTLKERIQLGNYPEGELLPSENELCEEFKTTRATVRQALMELVKEGYIERFHGKGSVVKTQIRRLGLLAFQGFSQVVENPKSTVIQNFVKSSWPDPFFFQLSPAEKKAGCVAFERLRSSGNEPLMLEKTYLPAFEDIENLITKPLIDGSLFQSLRTYSNIEVVNLEQSIRAIGAENGIAKLLALPRHTPIVYIERRYATSVPDVYVYSELYCNTQKFSLSHSFS